MTDYISDAPRKVLESIAEVVFARIDGKSMDYGPDLLGWITGSRFCEYKQQLYLQRCSNIARSQIGRSKNLKDSYERLMESGLVKKVNRLYLSWTNNPVTRKIGHCSVLMNVITISKVLDSDDVPDYVLDYCLYRELCLIRIGFGVTGTERSDKLEKLLDKYPRMTDAEVWLKIQGLYT